MAHTTFGSSDELLMEFLVDQRTKRVGRLLHILQCGIASRRIGFILAENTVAIIIERLSSYLSVGLKVIEVLSHCTFVPFPEIEARVFETRRSFEPSLESERMRSTANLPSCLPRSA